MKCYNSVKVKNPHKDFHIVKLFPNQKMIIEMSDYKNISITSNSSFLTLEKWNQGVYYFKQKTDLSYFSKVCSLYLGEININRIMEKVSTICVFLASDKETFDWHPSYVSIINPNENYLFFEPHQVLEVSLLTKKYPEIKTSQEATGFGLENIGSSVFSIHSYKENIFKSSGFHLEQFQQEHRFRFQFTPDTVSQSNSLSDGKYPAGFIHFKNENIWNRLNVYLNIKGKNRHKLKYLPKVIKPVKKPVPRLSKVTIKPLEDQSLEKGCCLYTPII